MNAGTVEAASDWRDLFRTALDWHAVGHRVAIATVVDSWGSAPRRPGGAMIIRADGGIAGSVSGGCVEGEVIVAAQDLLATPAQTFRMFDFSVSDGRAWEVGLACGGALRILLQRLDDLALPASLVAEAVEQARHRRTVTLETDLQSGRTVAHEDADDAPSRVETIHIAYAPPARLAIVGAVHIAQHLAPLAQSLGYDVVVIDPRGAFATPERFPGILLELAWPDEALSAWAPDGRSAIVSLTHDIKLDDPALKIALGSDSFYVAALGSRRTQASRLERLAAAGLDQAALGRLHGPAGLPIGAQTPAEIALSIMAELTAARRGALRAARPQAA